MISLETESPGLAGTKTGAGKEADARRHSTAKTALQAPGAGAQVS